METTKIFSNGGSQAVRLPKQYRFNSEEVLINRIGNIVMLIPKDDQWENTLKSLDMFTDDFLADPIEPLPLENREAILLSVTCWTLIPLPMPRTEDRLPFWKD